MHQPTGLAARPPATGIEQPADTDAVLSWREKLSYGVADMGFNFYWTNIATFLLIFYTDTFGISAGAAATMMSAIKIVNAFTDPLIGAAADRTRTRFGKFRPWLVWMCLPLAGAAVLTYTTPNLAGDAKLAWAYGTYLLMMVCYTCVNIPYNALSGVISSDPQQRSTVNGLRFIFAFAGSTLVTAATPALVRWFGAGDDRRGWQLAMLAWALAASLLFVLTFVNTRERVLPPAGQRSNVWRDVRDLAGNRPWVVLFFLALIIMVTITLRTASAAYYFKYVVGRPELMAVFVPTYMVAAAIGAACTPLLTRRVDKKVLMIGLMSATAVLSAAVLLRAGEPGGADVRAAGRAGARARAEVAAGVLDVCRHRRLQRMAHGPARHRDDLRRRHLLAKARDRGGRRRHRLRVHRARLRGERHPDGRLARRHHVADVLHPGRLRRRRRAGDVLLQPGPPPAGAHPGRPGRAQGAGRRTMTEERRTRNEE